MDLKTLIKQSGYKQGWLGAKIGLNATYFNNMVTGRAAFPVRLVEPLAAALGVPVAEIVSAVNHTERKSNGSRKSEPQPSGPQAESSEG